MKIIKTASLLMALISLNAFAREELVLKGESSFNPTHANRFSVMLGLNPSLTKSADVSNFTLSYARELENFWIDSNLVMTKGKFLKLSANNQSATGAFDTQIEDQENSLTTIGIGIGRETRYAQTLLPIDDLYEIMAANLTYNMYKEDFSAKTFNGPGILAKFSLYKRFNEYFSAGTHFNYNLAVVKRSQDFDTETSSQRSLTLGFLTVGIDLSFYL
jgi:hypothetical protein